MLGSGKTAGEVVVSSTSLEGSGVFFVCVYVRKFASLSSLSVFGSVVVGNLCLVSAYIYL